MSLEATIEKVKSNLLHGSYIRNVFGETKLIVPRFLSLIEDHFAKMENDEVVEPTEDEVLKVKRVLDLCKMIIIEIPITDALRELVDSLCLLIYNWNSNTLKDERIERDVKFIRNAVEMHFTLLELIQFAKTVVREMTKKSSSSLTNTDEISMHFLSAIDAIQKEKECNENICSES